MTLIAGGSGSRFGIFGSAAIMRSVAKRFGKEIIEFNYFMGSGSEKREFHGVYSIKDDGCYPVIDGATVFADGARSPHSFLKFRHVATTSSGVCRQYSATGIIMIMGKTLSEWNKLGESPSCRH